MRIISGKVNASFVKRAIAASVGALLLALPRPAAATLGGDEGSVEGDRTAMRAAQSRIERGETYGLHELRTPAGTAVREYVSPRGTVFGVAWQGPAVPDLRQLLGSYFDAYTAAIRASRGGRAGHGPVSIETPGLVVQVGGHQRAFQGRVYVPTLVPQGVDVTGIR